MGLFCLSTYSFFILIHIQPKLITYYSFDKIKVFIIVTIISWEELEKVLHQLCIMRVTKMAAKTVNFCSVQWEQTEKDELNWKNCVKTIENRWPTSHWISTIWCTTRLCKPDKLANPQDVKVCLSEVPRALL